MGSETAPLFSHYVSFNVRPHHYLCSIFFAVLGLVMSRFLLIVIYFFSTNTFANWIPINSGSVSTTGTPESYCSTLPGAPVSEGIYSFDLLGGDSYQCKFWGGSGGSDPCSN